MAPLPLTLVSGWDSGASDALLAHAVQQCSAQGVRCAVVRNTAGGAGAAAQPGGAVSAAAIIADGCICCSAEQQLVQRLVHLAQEGVYDCILVQGACCSSPSALAEVLAFAEVPASASRAAAGQPLESLVRLDTCVTVVSAAHLLADMATAAPVAEAPPCAAIAAAHEERLPELLLEQLEWANLIVVDGPCPDGQLQGLLSAINPSATVAAGGCSSVGLAQLVRTGRFSMDAAQQAAGWMQALADSSGGSSGDCVLVYRARRPFHPGRLHTFMAANLSLRQPEAHQHAGSCAHDGGDHRHHHHCGDGGSCSHSHSHQQPPQPVTSRGDSAEAAQQLQRATAAANAASSAATAAAQRLQEVSSGDAMAASAVQACAPAVAAAAQAAAAAAAATAAAAGWLADRLAVAASTAEPQAPAAPAGPLEGPARGVVRAKGYAWLATRPDHCGDWSQAGRLLTFGAGGAWFDALPRAAWPSDAAAVAQIEAAFQPGIGDRRQELAFIGTAMDQAALRQALDACLCTPAEAELAAAGQLPDPFVTWPSVEEMLEGDMTEEDESDDEPASPSADSNASTEAGSWRPGRVMPVTQGAAEAQEFMADFLDCCQGRSSGPGDASSAPPLVAIEWVAPWAAASAAASPDIERLAGRLAGVLFLRLDVGASMANQALAYEKVMQRPVRQRDAHPVLKAAAGDAKWPCATLHIAPELQPLATLAGAGLAAALEAALLEHGAVEGGPAVALDAAATPGGQPAGAGHAASPAAPAAAVAAAVTELRAGATDLKRCLAAAGSAPLVLMWHQGGGAGAALDAFRALAGEAGAAGGSGSTPAPAFAAADAAASPANRVLAGALKVKLPGAGDACVQVYRSMAVQDSLAGGADSVLSQLRGLLGLPAAAGHGGGAAPAEAAAGGSDGAAAGAQAASSSEGAALAAGGEASTSTAASSSAWDPPPAKFAKPGFRRQLPGCKGDAVFWPRMPCLRCGCPWWLGEDWDAKCARCRWSCETDGYDDDSNPLPAYRDKFDAFRAEILAGRTPEWKGRAGASGSSGSAGSSKKKAGARRRAANPL